MTRINRCKIFLCSRRNLDICCHDCAGYEKCNIKCLNSPEKCGMFEHKEKG